MKTYITEQTINDIADTIKRYITPEAISILKRISKKHNIEFNHNKQTNVNLLWLKVIQEIDSLPLTDTWKTSLSKRNLFWNNENHSTGVTLPLVPTVKDYMSMKGYLDDYETLSKFETKELEEYLYHISRVNNIPSIRIEDMINSYPDFKEPLKQYSKKYADKEALKYTEKIINIIDDVFKGEFVAVNKVYGTYKELVYKEASKEDMFDIIHAVLHK